MNSMKSLNNFKKIPKQKVIQDHDHDKYVTALFKSIIDACRDEFTEDNLGTLGAFCDECYEKAMQEVRSDHIRLCGQLLEKSKEREREMHIISTGDMSDWEAEEYVSQIIKRYRKTGKICALKIPEEISVIGKLWKSFCYKVKM